jgi:hypothetical protein
MTEQFNAASGHGQDWGMDTDPKGVNNLSSAHDHDRAATHTVHVASKSFRSGDIEYRQHNLTIYKRSAPYAEYIKADDY